MFVSGFVCEIYFTTKKREILFCSSWSSSQLLKLYTMQPLLLRYSLDMIDVGIGNEFAAAFSSYHAGRASIVEVALLAETGGGQTK